MPKGLKGFQPGLSGNPNGRPLGSLNKTTLLKEERRAIFDEVVSQVYVKTILDAKPEYLLDQFLGKAPDKVEVDAVVVTANVTQEVLRIAEEELKRRKLNAKPKVIDTPALPPKD